jgi:hypothetical protein
MGQQTEDFLMTTPQELKQELISAIEEAIKAYQNANAKIVDLEKKAYEAFQVRNDVEFQTLQTLNKFFTDGSIKVTSLKNWLEYYKKLPECFGEVNVYDRCSSCKIEDKCSNPNRGSQL